ncbi:unannotated protein [freshwater metagenome]|uniref:Unannotated protein n=1 Tax=freshwater metagenome TaxID=449393 RepID=A0A6J7L7D0_9ZZZZ
MQVTENILALKQSEYGGELRFYEWTTGNIPHMFGSLHQVMPLITRRFTYCLINRRTSLIDGEIRKGDLGAIGKVIVEGRVNWIYLKNMFNPFAGF